MSRARRYPTLKGGRSKGIVGNPRIQKKKNWVIVAMPKASSCFFWSWNSLRVIEQDVGCWAVVHSCRGKEGVVRDQVSAISEGTGKLECRERRWLSLKRSDMCELVPIVCKMDAQPVVELMQEERNCDQDIELKKRKTKRIKVGETGMNASDQ